MEASCCQYEKLSSGSNCLYKRRRKTFCALKGYEECHNPDEVIEMMGYDSERDIYNPTGSVFCANGSGFWFPGMK